MALRQAEAGVDVARAQRSQTEADLARAQTLRRQAVMAQQEFDRLATGVTVAQAQERQATEALALARFNVGRTLVRAPYAGSVAKRLVDEGTTALVQPQTIVLVLQETGELEAEAAIPESQLALVQLGDQARLGVEGLAEPIAATVSAVSDTIDPATRTYLVKMRVPNADRRLKAGIFTLVEIVPQARTGVLVVPPDAIRTEDGRTRVLVVRDGARPPCRSRSGISAPDAVEVLERHRRRRRGAGRRGGPHDRAGHGSHRRPRRRQRGRGRSGRMRLPDTSIRRPVFAVMLIGGLVLLGLVSIPRLGLDLLPRVEFPIVTVTTILEGAAPETVEREVSQVLEESINTIEGIHSLRSASSDSLSLLFVEFELEHNVEVKAQEVRDRVAAVRGDLPRDVEPPVVDRVDPDASPILAVMLSGPALHPCPQRVRRQTAQAAARAHPRRRQRRAGRRPRARDPHLDRPDQAERLRAGRRRRAGGTAARARRDAGRPHRDGATRIHHQDQGQARQRRALRRHRGGRACRACHPPARRRARSRTAWPRSAPSRTSTASAAWR